MKNVVTALLTMALVSSLILGPGIAAAESDESQACTPENTVTYGDFRTNSEVIEEFNETDSVAVVRSNTRATVEDDEAFARVKVENPNSYCVEVVVEIAEEVVTPSTLGKVRAVDSDPQATWESTHDFDAGETYTRVRTVVPAETSVVFAPSQLRVESLAWTGRAQEGAGTLEEKVTGIFNDTEDLKQRKYEIEGESQEIVTVDLENPESGESIEEWQATYQLNGDGPKIPLDTGSDAPVFYRGLTNEEGETTGIQITFNKNATVNFVAEPTWTEKRSYGLDSYMAGIRDFTEFKIPIPGTLSGTGIGLIEANHP